MLQARRIATLPAAPAAVGKSIQFGSSSWCGDIQQAFAAMPAEEHLIIILFINYLPFGPDENYVSKIIFSYSLTLRSNGTGCQFLNAVLWPSLFVMDYFW